MNDIENAKNKKKIYKKEKEYKGCEKEFFLIKQVTTKKGKFE